MRIIRLRVRWLARPHCSEMVGVAAIASSLSVGVLHCSISDGFSLRLCTQVPASAVGLLLQPESGSSSDALTLHVGILWRKQCFPRLKKL